MKCGDTKGFSLWCFNFAANKPTEDPQTPQALAWGVSISPLLAKHLDKRIASKFEQLMTGSWSCKVETPQAEACGVSHLIAAVVSCEVETPQAEACGVCASDRGSC